MYNAQGKNKEPDRSPMPIGSVLKSVEYYLKANRQGLLAVQDCLNQILAPELLERTKVIGVQACVLTLWVPDAASKCLLDTILRGKAFAQLQEALPQMSLRKVKVILT